MITRNETHMRDDGVEWQGTVTADELNEHTVKRQEQCKEYKF